MGDLIHYVCVRAARLYGDRSLFNGANFSAAWQAVTGLRSGLDGYAVEAMLHGRQDVETIGGGHYQLRAPSGERGGGRP